MKSLGARMKPLLTDFMQTTMNLKLKLTEPREKKVFQRILYFKCIN